MALELCCGGCELGNNPAGGIYYIRKKSARGSWGKREDVKTGDGFGVGFAAERMG
jgi:hypothetical protein